MVKPAKLSWLTSISAFVRGREAENEEGMPVGRGNSKLMKMRQQEQRSAWQQVVLEVRKFFLGTKLNVLLFVLPFAAASKIAGWGDGPTCALSMIALVPLAERLGYVTEQLATYTNDSVGGLLNATFGNATELIICALAIRSNLLRVVQLSLLGSVISNLLLVMGTAFLAGGLLHPCQTFKRETINVHCALLLLAVIAVLLPTMLVTTRTQASMGDKAWGQDAYPIGSSSLVLSRVESVCLLGCYGLFLVFQLCTHKHLFEEEEGGEEEASAREPSGRPGATMSGRPKREMELAEMQAGTSEARTASGRPVSESRTASGRPMHNKRLDNGEVDETTVPLVLGAGVIHSSSRGDLECGGGGGQGGDLTRLSTDCSAGGGGSEDEEQELSRAGCFFWMFLVTALIALLSEWVVSAIEGASRELNVPLPFLVTILLPIVGNAAEHASAVLFAVRDRIELALGVAVGSSTQVSVLLVPFSVVLAWTMGRPLDLNLSAFEGTVFFVSVLLSIVTLQDGSSNWLKGLLLVLTYVFVAAGFWCHQDETLSAEQSM